MFEKTPSSLIVLWIAGGCGQTMPEATLAEPTDVGPAFEGRDDLGLGEDLGANPDSGGDVGVEDSGPLDAGFVAWTGEPAQVECEARRLTYGGGLDGWLADANHDRFYFIGTGVDGATIAALESHLYVRSYSGRFATGESRGEAFVVRPDLPGGPVYCATGTISYAQFPTRVSGRLDQVGAFDACDEATRSEGLIELCRDEQSCARVLHSTVPGFEGLGGESGFRFVSTFGGSGSFVLDRVHGYFGRAGPDLAWLIDAEGTPSLFCVGEVEENERSFVLRDLRRLGSCADATPVDRSELAFCYQSR